MGEVAVVQFEYLAKLDDELSLKLGDIITNIKVQDGGWWEGEVNGRRGVFPDNFVKLQKMKSNTGNTNGVHLRTGEKRRYCKALFSYSPCNDDELELKVDDLIEVIEEVEEGWWKGVLHGHSGVFPSNFVKETEPGNESKEESLINEIKTKVKGPADSGDSMSNSIKDNKNQATVKSTVIPIPSSDAPVLPPKQAKELAKVLFMYEAQNEDELTIREGDIITIISKDVEDKGWWKGELSGRTGVFPDNFVEILPDEPIRPKKPERFDKSAHHKHGLKDGPPPFSMESSSDGKEKLDKDKDVTAKSSILKKLPEIPKKVLDEKPERPAPPLPSKKPQLPPPQKKPLRLSVGSSFDSGTHGFEEPHNVSHKPSSAGPESNQECDLDGISTTSDKLIHLTANRAKNPNRRPPSNVFRRENNNNVLEQKENGDISKENQAPWMQELKKINAKKRASSTFPDSKDNRFSKEEIPENEEKPHIKPNNSFKKELEHKQSYSKPHISRPIVPSTASKPAVTVKITPEIKSPRSSTNIDIPSSPPLASDASLSELNKHIQSLKKNVLLRPTFDEYKKEIQSFQEQFETYRGLMDRQVSELKSELETERKMRQNLQSELDNIKKFLSKK